MRIVVARYGADVVGGAETVARMLARRLCDRGRAVEVVTTCAVDAATWANRLPAGTSDDGGVSVRRFPVLVPRLPRAFRQATRAFLRTPPALRPESAWVAAQGPWSPALVRALAAAPPVPTLFVTYLYHPTLRGLPRSPGPRILLPTAHDEPALRLRAVGRMLAACDAIWYLTPEERALLERVHPAAAALPCDVGAVGVDTTDGADPAAARARLGVSGPYLLYGGRVTPGKGVETLLEGLAVLRRQRPDAVLVLAGDAGTVGGADGVVASGPLDGPTWRGAVAGAAAVVVPSAMESLSLLALEAWASGRPVLVNGESAVLAGQVARSGGGLAYRGATGLAEAAARLLGDAAGADAMGSAGRRHVAAEYRWDTVLDRLDALVGRARAHRDGRP